MATKRATKKQEQDRIPPIRISDAKLIYRNFAGDAKKFNAKGLRNFHVVIDPAIAEQLIADGWNVRWHEPRNEDEDRWASLKVAVRFDMYPPTIILRTGEKGRTNLNGNTAGILDWAELMNVKLIITPSRWENADGKSGVKAYLSRMVVEVDEGDLEFEGIVPDEVDDPNESDVD